MITTLRARGVVGLLVAVTTAGLLTAASPSSASEPCFVGGAHEAAANLLTPGGWLASTDGADPVDVVAGLPTVLALEPTIAPGVRHRLVQVGDAWCTTAAFDRIADHHLPSAADVEVASVFASIAAAAYFDQVNVAEVSRPAADVVRLRTLARTNGVDSTWTIQFVDGRIQQATFLTTGIGVGADLDVSLEGVTSLPGNQRSWSRNAAGLLLPDATPMELLDRAAARAIAPGDDYAMTASDGFTIRVALAGSDYTPDTTIDTGVGLADRMRNYLDYAIENYEDFLSWGVVNPFSDQVGLVTVDDSQAALCLACATISEDAMRMWMFSLFPEVAELLVDIDYADNEEFVHGVIGHEMVHTLQGGYADGNSRPITSAFTEAIARASEALHASAHGTHQPRSIMYVDSANGCNGFNGTQPWQDALAQGPFRNHTYDACHYWLTYFNQHGHGGMHAAMTALAQVTRDQIVPADPEDHVEWNLSVLDLATGDATRSLAHWGAAAVTGVGYTLPAGLGGEVLDWHPLLEPVSTPTLHAGDSHVVEVSDGGVAVALLGSTGAVSVRGARGWVARVVGDRLEMSRVVAGETVSVAPDEVVAIVAVSPGAFVSTARISVA